MKTLHGIVGSIPRDLLPAVAHMAGCTLVDLLRALEETVSIERRGLSPASALSVASSVTGLSVGRVARDAADISSRLCPEIVAAHQHGDSDTLARLRRRLRLDLGNASPLSSTEDVEQAASFAERVAMACVDGAVVVLPNGARSDGGGGG